MGHTFTFYHTGFGVPFSNFGLETPNRGTRIVRNNTFAMLCALVVPRVCHGSTFGDAFGDTWRIIPVRITPMKPA